MSDAKELAAEKWYGYGRWDAPYWFVGMEPGGDDTHASYEAWLDLGGDSLIDCRAHHQWQLETRGIDNPKWTKYHRRDRSNALQSTWRPLILLLLAFKCEPYDTEHLRIYQRDRWGYRNDETAVVELNALHAPSIAATGVDRETYRPQRIRTIREQLLGNPPIFAVFYGQRYQDYYEQITQAKFDSEGFVQCGRTVCVLVPQPARSGWTNDAWCELGRRLRERSDVIEGVV